MWGYRRADRAHRERHDVERAAAHRAAEERAQLGLHLAGVAPVVGWAGVLLARAADERAVLDARDVARVGARPVGVRPLPVVEAREGARGDETRTERVVLLVRAVAPLDALGLEHPGPLLDPRAERRVRGRCGRRIRVHKLGAGHADPPVRIAIDSAR